ncbi:MipA/OmpV family protein [Bowmanella dokdonensis]|uniref:MipA/OmpV family protein n=1 Tax=Bowmanella dokdonensis TaxID=751969 RepID=A0A939DKV1_9ALTE|nr:MipA/OmpV family protein [Bowmanella dokdonensis]MBN7824157.1 MipA/OmpV family protein [Bowmanella dokdonensis]
MKRSLLATVLALTMSGQATAEGTWGLGLGMISAKSPYLGEADDFLLLPLISYESEDFRFTGVSFNYDLYETDSIQLSTFLRPGFDFFDADDADTPAMRTLNDRKFSALLGLEIKADLDFATAVLSAGHDITGNARGWQLELALQRRYQLSPQLFISPELGVTFADSDTVDYYYGVDSGESSQFAPYQADSALNPYASVTLMYQIDKRWQAFTSLKWSEYDNTITDSPIVDADRDLQWVAAVSYEF